MRRVAIGIAVATSVALLGLAGCGRIGQASGQSGDSTDMSWDAQALQAIGYSTEEVGAATAGDATAEPSPSTRAEKQQNRRAKFRKLRFAFGKRMLHGEAVVQTDEGLKTVVVQRGQVTAVNATTVTVKSSDGFTLTWTIGDTLVVVKDRHKTDPSAITVGGEVGVAGARNGDTTTARLLVIASG